MICLALAQYFVSFKKQSLNIQTSILTVSAYDEIIYSLYLPTIHRDSCDFVSCDRPTRIFNRCFCFIEAFSLPNSTSQKHYAVFKKHHEKQQR